MSKNYKKSIEQYGITTEQYSQMCNEQFFRCAICFGISSQNKRLSVDHCHETNLVRGLLCDSCNLGLGSFKDDISRLEGAIAYLREFEYKKSKLVLRTVKESYLTRVKKR